MAAEQQPARSGLQTNVLAAKPLNNWSFNTMLYLRQLFTAAAPLGRFLPDASQDSQKFLIGGPAAPYLDCFYRISRS
jgi:hypothetical protein